jgi:hypothetical protein
VTVTVPQIYSLYKSLYCSTHKDIHIFISRCPLTALNSGYSSASELTSSLDGGWLATHSWRQLSGFSLVNCSPSLPAQSFPSPSPARLTTIFHYLTTSGILQLLTHSLSRWYSVHNLGTNNTENTASNSSTNVTCVADAAMRASWADNWQRTVSSGSIIAAFQLSMSHFSEAACIN